MSRRRSKSLYKPGTRCVTFSCEHNISKAKQAPYKQFVLELFKTEEKIPFKYDDSVINFLYLNGVVDWELV